MQSKITLFDKTEEILGNIAIICLQITCIAVSIGIIFYVMNYVYGVLFYAK